MNRVRAAFSLVAVLWFGAAPLAAPEPPPLAIVGATLLHPLESQPR